MTVDEEYLKKIVQFLNDPADVTLQNDIEKSRALSPAHEAFFQEVYTLWASLATLKDLESINVAEATARLSQKLKQHQPHTIIPSENRLPLFQWLIRAAAILIIGAAGYWIYSATRITYRTKTTSTNVRDSVLLADGTRIYLDENSTLRYPEQFNGNQRTVRLDEGNAFFFVTPDKTHPFVVQLGESSVTVLGTSFNVNASNKEIKVSVKTGTVVFETPAKGAKSVVTAGKGIVYSLSANALTSIDIANKNADAWLTHELTFKDASLREVLSSLEEYYAVKFNVEDSIANFKKFNATFKNNALQEVLEVLQATYPIRYETHDTLVTIRKQP